jgi:hypothetical protein
VLVEGSVHVHWNGQSTVRIAVPKHLRVCGICGQQEKESAGPDLRAGRSYFRGMCPEMRTDVAFNQQVDAFIESSLDQSTLFNSHRRRTWRSSAIPG